MLTVREVSVSYGKIRALRRVSLEVHVGEIVALIGANGAGKSTLLRAIAGVLHPGEGAIVFKKVPITRMAPHRIARMGMRYVPEGRRLLARMTVWENLLLGQHGRPVRERVRADMEAVLARFPILDRRRQQLAGALSGGEQQMLAVARALVGRPDLLMLDEPSLGLAPLVVNEIFDVVRALKREGATILLVEQNARQALQVADRGYILETGRVASEGPTAELLAGEAVQRAYLGVGGGGG